MYSRVFNVLTFVLLFLCFFLSSFLPLFLCSFLLRCPPRFSYSLRSHLAQAMNRLGIMYINGLGVKQNLTKARKLVTRSATLENKEAIHLLKQLDYFERGNERTKTTVPKSKHVKKEPGNECPICLEELTLDATQFHRFSCCGQGIHHMCMIDMMSMKMSGNCPFCRAKTPTSQEEVVKQLRPWVKKKKAWACASMAETYYHGDQGLQQSYDMARRLYEQAAEQGDCNGLTGLARMYEQGKGVNLSFERAAELYQQSADLGSRDAQHNLALLYQKGIGVEQSYAKAKELFELAASANNLRAYLNLGQLYLEGHGVERDLTKARELWTKAVDIGCSKAKMLKGLVYGNSKEDEDDIQICRKNLKFLDSKEKEAAVNAVVCSFCGLPETATRNFAKSKCPCKSAWYCNTTCQKKHWKDHRNECKRLIAERRQKRKEKEADKERTASSATTTQEEGERKEDTTVPKAEPKNKEERRSER